ncbi:Uncharacterised protein [Clostridioides difficile]|uniref:hypothetical protein n=1 Tax=Clostridioides difficile TaxID=1496 RepID=UPI000D1F3DCA|nr:hypothetical protein [Clostridioides difficile]UWD41817.1 hypothetical protein NYF05_02400 [Clostridioides difficile]UWD45456.1 hypothetical protein NYU56_02395 [Clostridioides difficile]VFF94641.1 Uncharacterised protein [Clostridioides difficile]VIG08116.1 Uncharacterised protein [Clostridioides difficile]HBE9435088.1 hypothetical protein [Clostridioides difficile]
MDFGNLYLVLIGIGVIIGTTIRYLIKRKTNYCKKKYLDKLELKYGNIDREKVVKLEIFYQYLIGIEDIAIGLLIKNSNTAIISIILVSIVTIISYYLIRKKYITL